MFEIFKYINIAPIRILGMLVFVAIMLGFIMWVSGFRKKTRQLMKNKKYFLAFSGVLLVICLGSLIFKGLNFGLDFTGGTVVQLAIRPDVKIPQISQAIKEFAATTKDSGHYDNPKIQLAVEVESRADLQPEGTDKPAPDATATPASTGEVTPAPTGEVTPAPTGEVTPAPTGEVTPAPSPTQEILGKDKEMATVKSAKLQKFRKVMIQIQKIEGVQIDSLVAFLNKKLDGAEILKSESVGPTIGEELKSKALLALAIALLAQLIYITFRFGTKMRFGLAADVALIHDLIIMVGIYSLLGKPVDSPFLAALLTIIGYSVMDTVVVFDRVRENLKLMKGSSYEETVNLSLNQVMTRTAATSFTTILTLFAIYYFGGDTLHNFALALLIGAVAGTYSSLFVASPLIIWIDDQVKGKERKRVEERRARLEEEARSKSSKKAKETPAPEKEKAGNTVTEEKEEAEADSDSDSESESGDSKKKSKKGSRKRRR